MPCLFPGHRDRGVEIGDEIDERQVRTSAQALQAQQPGSFRGIEKLGSLGGRRLAADVQFEILHDHALCVHLLRKLIQLRALLITFWGATVVPYPFLRMSSLRTPAG